MQKASAIQIGQIVTRRHHAKFSISVPACVLDQKDAKRWRARDHERGVSGFLTGRGDVFVDFKDRSLVLKYLDEKVKYRFEDYVYV